IDIVARGSARSIIASRAGFNGDCLRWANCLAKLARDAAFLAVRITTQGMFATKAWRDRAFLERIIERRFRLEEVAHGQHEAGQELRQKQAFGGAFEHHRFLISSPRWPVRRPGCRRLRSPPSRATMAGILPSRAASVGRSDSVEPWPWPWRTGKT